MQSLWGAPQVVSNSEYAPAEAGDAGGVLLAEPAAGPQIATSSSQPPIFWVKHPSRVWGRDFTEYERGAGGFLVADIGKLGRDRFIWVAMRFGLESGRLGREGKRVAGTGPTLPLNLSGPWFICTVEAHPIGW